MSPKLDRKEQRKAQIMNAALEMFIQHGIQNTTMDQVAEQAGLSKGTLYLYFKSKDDLFFQIIGFMLNREQEELRKLILADINPLDKINQFVDFAINDMQQLEPLLPMVYDFLGMAARNEAIQYLFKSYFEEFVELMIPIFEQGIHLGVFKPVDPGEAAMALAAVLEGTMLLSVYSPERVNLQRNLRSGVNILFDGLLVS